MMKDAAMRTELAALYQELQLASVVENWDAVYGVGVRLSALRAALEANPPLEAPVLAEVEGWIDKVELPYLVQEDGDSWTLPTIMQDNKGWEAGAVPVTVTIRGRGDVPEPPAISSSIR